MVEFGRMQAFISGGVVNLRAMGNSARGIFRGMIVRLMPCQPFKARHSKDVVSIRAASPSLESVRSISPAGRGAANTDAVDTGEVEAVAARDSRIPAGAVYTGAAEAGATEADAPEAATDAAETDAAIVAAADLALAKSHQKLLGVYCKIMHEKWEFEDKFFDSLFDDVEFLARTIREVVSEKNRLKETMSLVSLKAKGFLREVEVGLTPPIQEYETLNEITKRVLIGKLYVPDQEIAASYIEKLQAMMNSNRDEFEIDDSVDPFADVDFLAGAIREGLSKQAGLKKLVSLTKLGEMGHLNDLDKDVTKEILQKATANAVAARERGIAKSYVEDLRQVAKDRYRELRLDINFSLGDLEILARTMREVISEHYGLEKTSLFTLQQQGVLTTLDHNSDIVKTILQKANARVIREARG